MDDTADMIDDSGSDIDTLDGEEARTGVASGYYDVISRLARVGLLTGLDCLPFVGAST